VRLTLPSALLTGSPWSLRWSAVLFAGLCVLIVAALGPNVSRSIEERVGDTIWRTSAALALPEGRELRVIVVDIDEASIAKVGPWPWPRERLADLARELSARGAGMQIYDIVFPEPRPGDDALAAEIARSPVVLSQIFSLDPGTTPAIGSPQGALKPGSPPCAVPLPEATGFIANAPAFASVHGLAAGHITPRIAPDGAVRHLPALICFRDRVYPALGLAALVKAASADSAWTLAPGSGWLQPAWRLSHPALPGIVVPLDVNGDARLSYRVPRRAFVSISAADVLEGRAPADVLRGAWVLIGATAFGVGDAVPTPHGGAVAGVEVHGQFITSLLDGRVPYSPRGAAELLLLLAVAGGAVLLLSAHGRRLPALGLPLVGVLLALAFLALHAWLQLRQDVWLGWANPAAFCVLAGVMLAAAEHARVRFERERLYGNLSSYLPAPVAARIAFHEPTGAIDAQRAEITVLFADIRNFSAYCEGRPPEEAAALLHAFFTTAARVVEARGGLVEEFIGDAIMAVWNSPQPCSDHSAKALAAAHQLQAEADELFCQNPPPGLEPLALGIGIETGNAMVGSFGPASRRTYTALGETVTVAARLQALTVDLAQPILLGEGAAARLGKDVAVPLGSFLLEGLRTARMVYSPSLSGYSTARDDGKSIPRPRLVSGRKT
jgi:adenylate cyclase